MLEQIFVAILAVLAVGAGVWGWWIDNVGIRQEKDSSTTINDGDTNSTDRSNIETNNKEKQIRK